ncbi:MAG: UDP-N-acetylmuramoyl-L-alanine--D-glutamate ligase [Candidatus Cloacimonetes bacterium 4572_55]|nr:MAG: UDP-N-acetylmuramoyl-L-alanine--D-glutamate ligase [Candidatus Cloacimonetes bacterium 4572_55]
MKSKQNLKGKRVTVMGFARSGQAVARLLNRRGACVFVSDLNKTPILVQAQDRFIEIGIDSEIGRHSKLVYLNKDLIVLSPGIPCTIPILQEARARRVPIVSEIEIAYQMTNATVIGVTGTNGKSTTTALIGELLKRAGYETEVAGNIGYAASNVATDLSDKGYLITELSSFQLETIDQFRPHIAVLLNITPDHLDRYPSMKDYISAKTRIFKNQHRNDFAVFNADDPLVRKAASHTRAKQVAFSLDSASQNRIVTVEQNNLYLNDPQVSQMNHGKKTLICSIDELNLKGAHNLQNVIAALTVAHLLKTRVDVMRDTLTGKRGFKGLSHRLEYVATKNGVAYYNDSKATTVESTLAAINSFESVLLIVGGIDKGSDFSPLYDAVRKRVKELILIGKAKKKIFAALKGAAPLTFADDLEAAVDRISRKGIPGDIALLSPACASFDMFANFEDRGDCFRRVVHQLKD